MDNDRDRYLLLYNNKFEFIFIKDGQSRDVQYYVPYELVGHDRRDETKGPHTVHGT